MWLKLTVLLGILTSLTIEDDSASNSRKDNEQIAEEIPYSTPVPAGHVYLAEHFDDRADFYKKWVMSEAKKEGAEDSVAKYDGKWDVEEAQKSGLSGDLGLVLKSKAHHHAIATRLDKPFLFDNKLFILQYEVHFQNGQECGGAYVKILSQIPDLDLRNFHDKTPYTLMFGPDKCGNDHKLHFIFRHRNPKNGSLEEKHWNKATSVPKLDDVFKDKKPHLFTLVLKPDNKFEIFLDQKSVHKGDLLEDFSPPVNPPAEIDDPTDMKPVDWDEREKIPDPTATKPDDWDEDAPRQVVDINARKPDGWLDGEPELIPDPNAEKPSDWDDEMDGEWEPPLINNPKCEKVGCGAWKAPLIDNPRYKGKWRPNLIDNPNYKGKWKPQRIANPHFFEDKYPYKMTPVAAIGFELWSMVDGIMFDNIVITDDMYVADQWAAETFALKRELADRETTLWKWILKKTNNHPYIWLLYLAYCAVPIVLYVRHLRCRVKEDNMLMRLFKYTNKNPWLWAVYVIVIGLPVVLFISFCCTTSTSPSRIAAAKEREAKQKSYAKKAFSKPSEDTVKETKEDTIKEVKEEEEEEEDEIAVVGEEESIVTKEESAVIEEQPEVAITDDDGDVDEVKEPNSEETVEEIAEKEEVIGETVKDVEGSGDFPRRRRPRKE